MQVKRTLWGISPFFFIALLAFQTTVICAEETVVTINGETTCSDDLALCFSQKVAVETRESMVLDNLNAVKEQFTAAQTTIATQKEQIQTMEKEHDALQEQHKQDMEKLTNEMESLREIHTTQLGLMLSKNTELEESVDMLKSEKQTSAEEIQRLQKHVDSFSEQNEDLVEMTTLRESCATAASEHQQAAASWEETRLAMITTHEVALESSRKEAAEECAETMERQTISSTETCNQQLEAQTETCTQQLAIHTDNCSAQVAQASTCVQAISECQATCSKDCETTISSQEAIAGRWKRRHERLLSSHIVTREKATNTSSQLRDTRDELHNIRRELFEAKEQLRKPRIQRRLLYTWALSFVMPAAQWATSTHAAMPDTLRHVQTEQFPMVAKTIVLVKDILVETWYQAEDVFREATGWHKPIQTRGMPSSKKSHPYNQHIAPLYTDHWLPLYKQQIQPFYQDHIVSAYANHVVPSVAPIYHDHLLPHYQQHIVPVYTDQLLPIYHKHIEPAYQKYLQPIYDNSISPACKTIQEYMLQAAHTHESYARTIAHSFAWLADVVADYGSLQEYSLFTVTGTWFRDHALLVVRCLEGAIVIFLLGSLTRKKQMKKVM